MCYEREKNKTKIKCNNSISVRPDTLRQSSRQIGEEYLIYNLDSTHGRSVEYCGR